MLIPEQFTAKGQVKTRPPIIDICDFLLTDSALNAAMVNLLAFLNDRGATVSWYVTSSYKVKYHGEDLVGIKLGNGFKNTLNTMHFCDGHRCCDYDMTVTSPVQLENARMYLQDKITRIDDRNRAIASTSGKSVTAGNPVKLSKLDIYIADFPASETKDNIVRFVTWLREQKMAPQLFSPNSYKVSYKGTRLCYIRLPRPSTWQAPGAATGTLSWAVEFVRDGYGHGDAPKDPKKNKMPQVEYTAPMDYDGFIDEDLLKNFLLSGLKQCRECYACKPGMPIVINGKPYNMCKIVFKDPNEAAVTNLCDILHHRKANIDTRKSV